MGENGTRKKSSSPADIFLGKINWICKKLEINTKKDLYYSNSDRKKKEQNIGNRPHGVPLCPTGEQGQNGSGGGTPTR